MQDRTVLNVFATLTQDLEVMIKVKHRGGLYQKNDMLQQRVEDLRKSTFHKNSPGQTPRRYENQSRKIEAGGLLLWPSGVLFKI